MVILNYLKDKKYLPSFDISLYAHFPNLPNDLNNDEFMIHLIGDTVCRHYNIDFIELKNNTSRKKEYIDVSTIIYYMIKCYRPKISLTAIGRIFNRDHATILHHINKINNLMSYDNELKEQVAAIKIKIRTQIRAIINSTN
jgi:chromosomal replication initiation ATPase DnaA